MASLRDSLRSPRGLATFALAAAAIVLMAYRFTELELAAFILDEPQLLAAARAQIDTGHLALASPLIGTQGISYGPTVVWFYGVVHLLFGPDPTTHIASIGLLLTVAQLSLAASLARAFHGGVLLFGVIAILIASSPYHVFWSRLAWDLSYSIYPTFAVALLALPGPVGWRRAIPIGLLLGLGVSSHPMVLPFALVVLGVIALEGWRMPRKLLPVLLVTVAGATIVTTPYLLYLHDHSATPLEAGGFTFSAFLEFLVEPVRVATTWNVDYFFDHNWSEFLATTGPWISLGLVGLIVVGGIALFGLAANVRTSDPTQRRLVLLAVATWIGYAIFFSHRGVYTHPHYQFPTWWVVTIGTAGALAWLRRRSPTVTVCVGAVVLVIAMLQAYFIVSWKSYVREHGGTSGPHYSTVLSEQRRLVMTACSAAPNTVIIDNRTQIFGQSVAYLALLEPRCSGKRLGMCRAPACPPPSAELAVVTVSYAAPSSGLLLIR